MTTADRSCFLVGLGAPGTAWPGCARAVLHGLDPADAAVAALPDVLAGLAAALALGASTGVYRFVRARIER